MKPQNRQNKYTKIQYSKKRKRKKRERLNICVVVHFEY